MVFTSSERIVARNKNIIIAILCLISFSLAIAIIFSSKIWDELQGPVHAGT